MVMLENPSVLTQSTAIGFAIATNDPELASFGLYNEFLATKEVHRRVQREVCVCVFACVCMHVCLSV